jgi:hypothetical protein
MYPGRGYAVELYFDTGKGAPYSMFSEGKGRFRGWKVNMEAAFRRSDIGFDTIDDILDIFVNADDGSWYWTDEDELAYWVEVGAYTVEERGRFFASGFAAEELIRSRLSPFDKEWTEWQPPAKYESPSLPEGWQFLPGADFTLSTGRRYDAWRPGQDVERIIAGWWSRLDQHAGDPFLRRFTPARP